MQMIYTKTDAHPSPPSNGKRQTTNDLHISLSLSTIAFPILSSSQHKDRCSCYANGAKQQGPPLSLAAADSESESPVSADTQLKTDSKRQPTWPVLATGASDHPPIKLKAICSCWSFVGFHQLCSLGLWSVPSFILFSSQIHKNPTIL